MRYRFDDFEADSEAFVLRRAGREVAISPLSLQLVLLLLERRGRLVAKEELFAELWPDRAVADAALATCLSAARKALGDDARHPRYLITRHGKGVCFSPEVEVVVAAAGALGSAPREPSRTLGAAPIPRRRLAGPVGLAIVVALGLGAVGLGRWRSAVSPVDAVEGRVAPTASGVVLLVPFGPETGDAELELLSLAVSEALARRLEAAGWTVLGPASTRELATTAASIAEVAAATGADPIVTGGLRRLAAHQPPELLVEIHRPGRSGDAESEQLRLAVPLLDNDRSLDGLAVTVEQVATRVGPNGGPPAAVELPAGVMAYRLYLRGLKWLDEPGCDAGARGELLEQSLGLEPTFAATSILLARLHRHLGTNCLFGARHLEEGLARAEAVAQREPDLLEAWVLAAALRHELGDLEGALENVDAMGAAFPRAPGPACLALQVGPSADRPIDAEALAVCERARGLSRHVAAPLTLLIAGEYDRFLRHWGLDPSLRGRYLRAFATLRLGREPEAREILEPLFELSPAEVWGRLAHLLLAVIEGRGTDAARIAEALATVRTAAELGDAEIDYHLGQLLVLAGEIEAARRQLDRARSNGFACGWCFERDPVLERLRVLDGSLRAPSG